jgi:hypothetical protein
MTQRPIVVLPGRFADQRQGLAARDGKVDG